MGIRADNNIDRILWLMTHLSHEWTDLWPTWPM